jgi:hypothetical protein
MKTQLLEDIGENHSLPIIPPTNTTAASMADKWHAGPWRQREAIPVEQRATPAPVEPPPPPIHSLDPDPLAECWAIANPEVGQTWFERRGRRAAAWSAALAAAVLMAGGAAWLYNETKTDQALAVASAALDTPAVASVMRTPIAPVEPIDVQASELAPLAMDFYADVPDFEPTPVAAKPPRRSVRAVAKAPRRAPPPAPAPDPAAVRASQMAETLRQCRAAGYHAEQCRKRSCVATPYGIACKG